jgi:hypothetical protein
MSPLDRLLILHVTRWFSVLYRLRGRAFGVLEDGVLVDRKNEFEQTSRKRNRYPTDECHLSSRGVGGEELSAWELAELRSVLYDRTIVGALPQLSYAWK